MRGAPHATRLIVHTAVAAGLVGAALVLIALGVAGLGGADPRMVYPAAHLVDAWVVAPLAVTALVTGIAQARSTGRSLLGTGWVRAKLIITAGMTAVVIFVLEPRLGMSAEQALAGQPVDRGDFLPLAVAPTIALALVLVNVTLGITARGRSASPRTTASSRRASTPR